jgi:hypothetical protein
MADWEADEGWLHEAKGNNFRAWFATVEELTAASRAVYDLTPARLPDGTELMLGRNAVAAMLYGLAIECALKGLWVRGGRSLIKDGKFLAGPGAKDHKLHLLAAAVADVVELDLSADELNVLERLSKFVIFAGRYPVSLKPEGMAPVKSLDGELQHPVFFSTADFGVTMRLLNRFTTALNPLLAVFKAKA